MTGPIAVCFTCGAVYYSAEGHACWRWQGASLGDFRWLHSLIPAVTLPEGTPHPDPFLAERGWLVVGGIFQRPEGGGDGEEAAA